MPSQPTGRAWTSKWEFYADFETTCKKLSNSTFISNPEGYFSVKVELHILDSL